MRLFYSPASPFVAKVRMAARHCGIDVDLVKVDTAVEDPAFLKANPLGKIPALVLDDGNSVFDSRTICEVLDRMSGNQLLPQKLDEFSRVRTFEAACDGVMDALILIIYEGRARPPEKHHQPWLDKQMGKADRGLAWLEAHHGELPFELTSAHFALAALLGWMSFRYEGKVEAEHPKLAAWLAKFPEIFPAFEETGPRKP